MANNRPDWGAALQSLGQSLSGYAQQDYERKRMAYEQEKARQQQLADRQWQLDQQIAAEDRRNKYQESLLSGQRAYQESLDPFVNTPPKSLERAIDPMGLASGSSIPLGNTPEWQPWMTEDPSRIRQSDLNQRNFEWAKMLEDASLRSQNDEADARRRMAELTLKLKNEPDKPPSETAMMNYTRSLVTPDETAVLSDAYANDVAVIARDLVLSQGYPMDASTAAIARATARQMNPSTVPDLRGGLERQKAGQGDEGKYVWVNPKVQFANPGYTPGEKRWRALPDWGWLPDDIAPQADVLPLPGLTGAAANLSLVPGMTDSTYIESVLPKVDAMLDRGTLYGEDINQMTEWGVDAGLLQRILQRRYGERAAGIAARPPAEQTVSMDGKQYKKVNGSWVEVTGE